MVEGTQEEGMLAMCRSGDGYSQDGTTIGKKSSAASGTGTAVPGINPLSSTAAPLDGPNAGTFGKNQSNNEQAPTGNNDGSISGIGIGSHQSNNNPAAADDTRPSGPGGRKPQHFKTLRRWGTLGRSKMPAMPSNDNMADSGTSSATSFSEKKSLGKRIGGKIKDFLGKEKTKFKI